MTYKIGQKVQVKWNSQRRRASHNGRWTDATYLVMLTSGTSFRHVVGVGDDYDSCDDTMIRPVPAVDMSEYVKVEATSGGCHGCVFHTGKCNHPVSIASRGTSVDTDGTDCQGTVWVRKPRYIAFTAETFPPLNQVELRSKRTGNRYLVLAVGDKLGNEHNISGVRVAVAEGVRYFQFDGLLEGNEIRINGSEWQPCGVLV